MKTDSQNARRQLDFRDKPYQQRTFYFDVKSEDVRRKVSNRVKELGGHIEEFLSKDVQFLITDSTFSRENSNTGHGEVTNEKSTWLAKSKQMNSVPLSRGKALLMKAAQHGKTQSGSQKVNDTIHNALNLGVMVEKASDFLKSTQKLASKLRRTKSMADSADMDGVTPIQWKAAEKENLMVVKFEDENQLFKPIIKHLEKFPAISYKDNLQSPFDKQVILQKTTEKRNNRYSTKRKNSVSVSLKGGFCEPCDYWYKCSLREHLNSEKHQRFARKVSNFENLDLIINKLPSVADFTSKFMPPDIKTHCKDTEIIIHQDNNLVDTVMKKLELNESNLQNVPSATPMDLSNNSSMGHVPVMNCVKVTSANEAGLFTSHNQNPTDQKESDMEVDISSRLAMDECSKDSGTGQDLKVNTHKVRFEKKSNKHNRFMSENDSALPHDSCTNDSLDCPESIVENSAASVECYNGGSCDNAVFLDITNKVNNMPVQTATSTIRRKLSSFSISEVNSQKDNMSDYKSRQNSSEFSLNSLSFSGIENVLSKTPVASPIGHQPECSFLDVASSWMTDISKKTSTKARGKENKDKKQYSKPNEKPKKRTTQKRTRKQKAPKSQSCNVSVPLGASSDILSFYQHSLSSVTDLHNHNPAFSNSDTIPLSSNVDRWSRENVNVRSPVTSGFALNQSHGFNSNLLPNQTQTTTGSQPLVGQIGFSQYSNCFQTHNVAPSYQTQHAIFDNYHSFHQPHVSYGTNVMSQSSHQTNGNPYLQHMSTQSQPQHFSNTQQYFQHSYQSYNQCNQQRINSVPSSHQQYKSVSNSQVQVDSLGASLNLYDGSINPVYSEKNIENGYRSAGSYPVSTLSYQPCDMQSSQQNPVQSGSETLDYVAPTYCGLPLPFKNVGNLSNHYNSDTEGYTQGMSLQSQSEAYTEQSTESYIHGLQIASSMASFLKDEDSRDSQLTIINGCLNNSPKSDFVDVVAIDQVCEQSNQKATFISSNMVSDIDCRTPVTDRMNNTCDDVTPTNNVCEQNVTPQNGKDLQATPTKNADSVDNLSFSVKSILSNKSLRTPKQRTRSFRKQICSTPISPSPDVLLSKKTIVQSNLDNLKMKMNFNDENALVENKKAGKRKRHKSEKVNEKGGCQYVACPQDGIKLKLCKVMTTPVQQKSDLKSFWKVRKAGGCRLLFSAEKDKENKAVKRRENMDSNIVPRSKRRKCLV